MNDAQHRYALRMAVPLSLVLIYNFGLIPTVIAYWGPTVPLLLGPLATVALLLTAGLHMDRLADR